MTTQTVFTVSHEIDRERVCSLLCSAFEGGSNYWYLIDKAIYPKGTTKSDFGEGGKCQNGKMYWHWSQLVPTEEGGALLISSVDKDEISGKTEWRLDIDAIREGLRVMAKKYPVHFARIIDENDDGGTGDVFLQCCLFGELVFG